MHGNDVGHSINQFDVIADDGIDASKRTGSRHAVPVAIGCAIRQNCVRNQRERRGRYRTISIKKIAKPSRINRVGLWQTKNPHAQLLASGGNRGNIHDIIIGGVPKRFCRTGVVIISNAMNAVRS